MWADAALPAAANVASVMLDDREMSVSDIHPITFNCCLRRASSDDGQTARDQSYEIAGRRHVIKGGWGEGQEECRSNGGARSIHTPSDALHWHLCQVSEEITLN